MKRFLQALPGLVLLFAGCSDKIAGPEEPSLVFPQSNVSFTRHVEPLFQHRCAFSGCHGGSAPAAGLDLTTPSYSRLMFHQPQLVVAGEPANSLLIQRLTGAIPPRMPFNREPLTDNQLNGIRTWIQEGAQNN